MHVPFAVPSKQFPLLIGVRVNTVQPLESRCGAFEVVCACAIGAAIAPESEIKTARNAGIAIDPACRLSRFLRVAFLNDMTHTLLPFCLSGCGNTQSDLRST